MNFLRKRILSHGFHVLFGIFAVSAVAIAQTSFKVDDADAQQHLLKHVDPEYPGIAKAAQVQGEVVLQLDIGTDGRVMKATPLSGPPMLLQAAADAARQWQYKPFEEMDHR